MKYTIGLMACGVTLIAITYFMFFSKNIKTKAKAAAQTAEIAVADKAQLAQEIVSADLSANVDKAYEDAVLYLQRPISHKDPAVAEAKKAANAAVLAEMQANKDSIKKQMHENLKKLIEQKFTPTDLGKLSTIVKSSVTQNYNKLKSSKEYTAIIETPDNLIRDNLNKIYNK